jgi:hypothetical protein
MKKVQVCRACGSTEVLADAFASWNIHEQKWECDSTFDKGAQCLAQGCDGETRIIERDATCEEVEEARAIARTWEKEQPPKETCDGLLAALEAVDGWIQARVAYGLPEGLQAVVDAAIRARRSELEYKMPEVSNDD